MTERGRTLNSASDMANDKDARLDSAEVACLKTIGWLPWCRLYENGQDITATLTYVQLLDQLTKPVRYSSRAGRR